MKLGKLLSPRPQTCPYKTWRGKSFLQPVLTPVLSSHGGSINYQVAVDLFLTHSSVNTHSSLHHTVKCYPVFWWYRLCDCWGYEDLLNKHHTPEHWRGLKTDMYNPDLSKLNLTGVHRILAIVVGKAELQYVNTNTTSFCFLWELTFDPYILLPASSLTHDIPWELDGMCSTRSLLSFAWFSVYFLTLKI